MTVQTSVTSDFARGLAGQVADLAPVDILSKVAEGAVNPGVLVKAGTLPETDATVLTAAPVGDVNGWIETIGSTAGTQTLTGASIDGTLGGTEIAPAINVVLVLDSHADWDATTAVVTGQNYNGNVVSEDFSIPDGGNATVTGSVLFRTVTSLYIPAQSGTGGTATLGTGTVLSPVTGRDVLGLSLLDATQPGDDEDYDDADTMKVGRKGHFYVLAEETIVAQDPVFVRYIAGGGETVGALRNDEDGTVITAPDCALLEGARFIRGGTTAIPAVLELDLS